MRTLTKFILIFICIMIGGGIIAIIDESKGDKSVGPFRTIIAFAIIAAIVAIWRWKPDNDNNDNHPKLDKN